MIPPLAAMPSHSLRMALASCLADPAGPATTAQKTLWLHKLLDHTWEATPDALGDFLPTLQTWYDGLRGDARTVVHALTEGR